MLQHSRRLPVLRPQTFARLLGRIGPGQRNSGAGPAGFDCPLASVTAGAGRWINAPWLDGERRNAVKLHPGTADITVLPPVSMADWTSENLPERIEQIRTAYLETLAEWPTALEPGHRHKPIDHVRGGRKQE